MWKYSGKTSCAIVQLCHCILFTSFTKHRLCVAEATEFRKCLNLIMIHRHTHVCFFVMKTVDIKLTRYLSIQNKQKIIYEFFHFFWRSEIASRFSKVCVENLNFIIQCDSNMLTAITASHKTKFKRAKVCLNNNYFNGPIWSNGRHK